MDEAVAGHATRIEIELAAGDWLTVRDNGRGIPVDPHPRFPKKSALEVILTTLHSGGKFGGDAYKTSGGLHGVGVSVVNALSRRARSRGRARPPAVAAELQPRRAARPSCRIAGRCTTGAARRCAFIPTPRFSAAIGFRAGALCTAWRGQRPICSAASKSAGAAIRRCRARMACRPRRGCISPAGSAIFSRPASTARRC